MAVAGRALELQLELVHERLVVEQAGQLVVPRLVRQLRGRAVEVRDDALGDEPVDGRRSGARSTSSISSGPSSAERSATKRHSTRRRSRNSVTISRGAKP